MQNSQKTALVKRQNAKITKNSSSESLFPESNSQESSVREQLNNLMDSIISASDSSRCGSPQEESVIASLDSPVGIMSIVGLTFANKISTAVLSRQIGIIMFNILICPFLIPTLVKKSRCHLHQCCLARSSRVQFGVGKSERRARR